MVVDNTGKQIGVMTLRKAVELAQENNLDLVEVSSESKPPVCRILDYGKLKFLQAKKTKEAKKSQKTIVVKEVRFGTNMGDNDFDIKANRVRKFIQMGSKVKVSVFFKGRQVAYPEKGMIVLKKIFKKIEDVAKLDKKPLKEGRYLSMILTSESGSSQKNREVKSAQS
tara:strand:- start:1263 stop:1766 length:504 start_codon:yes stop_codon:yes gene_type:complete